MAGPPTNRTIQPGDNMACVDYPIINDTVFLEPDERFRVMFTVPNPTEAALVNVTMPTSTVTIIDDDSELHYTIHS